MDDGAGRDKRTAPRRLRAIVVARRFSDLALLLSLTMVDVISV
jgi:hypothetical protein